MSNRPSDIDAWYKSTRYLRHGRMGSEKKREKHFHVYMRDPIATGGELLEGWRWQFDAQVRTPLGRDRDVSM